MIVKKGKQYKVIKAGCKIYWRFTGQHTQTIESNDLDIGQIITFIGYDLEPVGRDGMRPVLNFSNGESAGAFHPVLDAYEREITDGYLEEITIIEKQQ